MPPFNYLALLVIQNDRAVTYLYLTLKVTQNSPGEKAGLVSFFDFIISANGQLLVRIRAAFQMIN